MFCRKCGTQIPDDSEFCFKCGASVKSDASATEQEISAKEQVEQLIDLGYEMLKKRLFSEADQYFENAIGFKPDEPRAYIGRLLASCELTTESDLYECKENFFKNSFYEDALRYADEETKERLVGYRIAYEDKVDKEKTALADRIYSANIGLFITGIVVAIISAILIFMADSTRVFNSDSGFFDSNFYWRLSSKGRTDMALFTVAVSLIALYVIVCIIIQLYYKNLKTSIILLVVSDIAFVIASYNSFHSTANYAGESALRAACESFYNSLGLNYKEQNIDDNIAEYDNFMNYFGNISVYAAITISVVFAIMLVIYLCRRKAHK